MILEIREKRLGDPTNRFGMIGNISENLEYIATYVEAKEPFLDILTKLSGITNDRLLFKGVKTGNKYILFLRENVYENGGARIEGLVTFKMKDLGHIVFRNRNNEVFNYFRFTDDIQPVINILTAWKNSYPENTTDDFTFKFNNQTF